MMIFPSLVRGLTFTVVKTPIFDTLIESAANKYDYRLAQTTNPFWSFQLTYNYLKDFPLDLVAGLITTDFRTMMDFFLAQQGQNASFLFLDPDDNQVGPALVNGVPNSPLAQLSVLDDGLGNYYSPLQRTFGGNFYEDVTDLNLNPLTGGVPLVTYANGVLQVLGSGGDYIVSTNPGLALPTASFMGQYLTWNRIIPVASVTLGRASGGSLAPTTYYVRVTRQMSSGGETLGSAEQTINVGTGTPSSGPALSQISGGSDGAQAITAVYTYVTPLGETLPSPSSPLSKTASNLLVAATPAASGDATGWNLYVAIGAAALTKVNSSPIALGTGWTEDAVTGIPTGGAAVPSVTTALGRLTVSGVASSFKTNDVGFNVYVSTATATETKQTASPVTYGTTWTEPTSGLIAGTALPIIDTSAKPHGPVTAQFGFYFRVRFAADLLDFEKFMDRLWCLGGNFSQAGSGAVRLATSRPVPL